MDVVQPEGLRLIAPPLGISRAQQVCVCMGLRRRETDCFWAGTSKLKYLHCRYKGLGSASHVHALTTLSCENEKQSNLKIVRGYMKMHGVSNGWVLG